jgi:hypothetical protein
MHHGEAKNNISFMSDKKMANRRKRYIISFLSSFVSEPSSILVRTWKTTNMRGEGKIEHTQRKNMWSRCNNKTDYQNVTFFCENELKSYVVPAGYLTISKAYVENWSYVYAQHMQKPDHLDKTYET